MMGMRQKAVVLQLFRRFRRLGIVFRTTFQLIVDNRVALNTGTLETAVREAAKCLQRPAHPKVEIINLSGGIFRSQHVEELVENLPPDPRVA